ncbi:hypothetical protein Enr13x_21200 [Stieleria neptunia]|uniref:Uncharacterized protein n=1 Tax=Stieleria neptunia TaxID=2527979 RepID=A0A518HN49_9BACT|nr:hypothetical protein Enr13x_21200 [Stieleria neptunia]
MKPSRHHCCEAKRHRGTRRSLTISYDGVYLSDDVGQNVAKVFDLNGSSSTNNAWQKITLDLDLLASANGMSLNNEAEQ